MIWKQIRTLIIWRMQSTRKCFSTIGKETRQVLDSSASYHVTPILSKFYKLVCTLPRISSYFVVGTSQHCSIPIKNVWVYAMRTKDKVYVFSQDWLTMLENHTDQKFKFLWADNEGKYNSNDFALLCKQRGIPHVNSCEFQMWRISWLWLWW